jgi:hypothetical protein
MEEVLVVGERMVRSVGGVVVEELVVGPVLIRDPTKTQGFTTNS